MAEVYVARARGIEGFSKTFVLKRILPELAGKPEVVSMFLHEARLAATLDHPNIAQVYDVGVVNDSYFFTMEYVHGADVRNLLRQTVLRRLTIQIDDAVLIGRDVCNALHYAHEKRGPDGAPLQIIHRDVSPSNVLLSYEGAVKVCDFGIAKMASQRDESSDGALKGKLGYMSPEQLRDEPLDRRSDIFAIAIMLYELTTQQKLFRGPSDYDVIKAVLEMPIPPPSKWRPGCLPELERIIMKGLERDRDKRYATAQEMQLELEELAREEKLQLSTVRLQSLVSETFDRRAGAWQRLQQSGTGENYLIKLESEEPRAQTRTDFDRPPLVNVTAERSRAIRRRWAQGGTISAMVLGMALLGAGLVERLTQSEPKRAAFATEVERLGASLSAQVRDLQMRAGAVATMPMLRAAIETDAATITDLVGHEKLFSPRPGEVMELVQRLADHPSVLVRIPPDATPLMATEGQRAELRIDDHGAKLLVTVDVAPLYADKGMHGAVVLGQPVDLADARQRISPLAPDAALECPAGRRLPIGPELPSSAARLTPVPLAAELGLPALSLRATAPKPSLGLTIAGVAMLAMSLLLFWFSKALTRRRAPT
jgi:serine/threonine protein kinase